MILKSKSVRKYNKDLKLVHELYNEDNEYIADYDSNGNLIYTKNWCKSRGKYGIDYEYEQKFNDQNKLVYFKNLEFENDETYYEYNENGKILYKKYNQDQFIKYIYDTNGNLIQEIDENGKILRECKYDEKDRLIFDNGINYRYLEKNKILQTEDSSNTLLINPFVSIIELEKCKKYLNNSNIVVFDKNYNVILSIDHNNNISQQNIYNDKDLLISSIFLDSYETYEYDKYNQILKIEVRNIKDGTITEIIEYENIYED